MPFHPYLSRNDLKLLAGICPNLLEPLPAAADLLLLRDVVQYLHPGQILGKRLSAPLEPSMGTNRDPFYFFFLLLFGSEDELGLVEQPQLFAFFL